MTQQRILLTVTPELYEAIQQKAQHHPAKGGALFLCLHIISLHPEDDGMPVP